MKWMIVGQNTPVCPACGKEQIHSDDGGGCYYQTTYCPWCGAKLEDSGVET